MKKKCFIIFLIIFVFAEFTLVYANEGRLSLIFQNNNAISIIPASLNGNADITHGDLALRNDGYYDYSYVIDYVRTTVSRVFLRPVINPNMELTLIGSGNNNYLLYVAGMFDKENGVFVSLIHEENGQIITNAWIPLDYFSFVNKSVQDSDYYYNQYDAAEHLLRSIERLLFVVIGLLILCFLLIATVYYRMPKQRKKKHRNQTPSATKRVEPEHVRREYHKNVKNSANSSMCENYGDDYSPEYETRLFKEDISDSEDSADADSILISLLYDSYLNSRNNYSWKNYIQEYDYYVSFLEYSESAKSFSITDDNQSSILAIITTSNNEDYIVPTKNMTSKDINTPGFKKCYFSDSSSWPAKIVELAVVEKHKNGTAFKIKQGTICDFQT
ncbi:MAG: hypothetical protein FWB80_00690 [Defluviitaleaceae bacterium]|nr:hypothetical protein [Defluviitaleaceae bacterium]